MTAAADILSHIVYPGYPTCGPVDTAGIDRLLRRAALPEGARILDLGCANAGWTRRALKVYPTATADGVDISASTLDIAAAAASADGVADRLRLHQADAATFAPGKRYGLVLCMSVSPHFGGPRATLALAARHLRPGGLVLLEEGFLEPDPPDGYRDLAGTLRLITETGWLPVYGHITDLGAWDDFYWTWIGTLNRWALDNTGQPAAAAIRDHAAEVAHSWLHRNRNAEGDLCVLLAPADGSSRTDDHHR